MRVLSASELVGWLESQAHLIGTGEEPDGLCGDREDHRPHLVTEGSLAPYWCTADQSRREPYRSERARRELTEVHPATATTPSLTLTAVSNLGPRHFGSVRCPVYDCRLPSHWVGGRVPS